MLPGLYIAGVKNFLWIIRLIASVPRHPPRRYFSQYLNHRDAMRTFWKICSQR